ncbi:hypothetical protein Tco_0741416 [Tanacetum coccineum]
MESSTRNYEFEMSMMGESIDSTKKIVLTLDKDCESIDSTKYRGMIDPKLSHLEADLRKLRFGISKVKEPLSIKLNEDEYFICCENTTHMTNALKKVRMESREMLLSIHHSLKMLLDIISKLNRKLEDEKVKTNEKGKEKVNDF